jgi:arginine utilization protein RocB
MIIKLASVTIPNSHLKDDTKELEKIKHKAKEIQKTTEEMEAEDSKAKKSEKK